jgi:hypothetical protein
MISATVMVTNSISSDAGNSNVIDIPGGGARAFGEGFSSAFS